MVFEVLPALVFPAIVVVVVVVVVVTNQVDEKCTTLVLKLACHL